MEEEKSMVRGVKHFPMYDKNPFGDSTTIEKKDALVGLGRKDIVIDGDSGEVVGQARMVISKRVDAAQFVKIFTSRIRDILELQPSSLKILFYFMEKAKKDEDFIDFDVGECLEFCNYKSSRSVFMALADLLNNKLIARANNPRRYFINPSVLFNGNRLTIVEDYQKVDKEEVEEDNLKKERERKELEKDIENSNLNTDEVSDLPFDD